MAKILCIAVVVSILIALCSANGNDYQWGTVGATDTLLARETVAKPGFLGMTVSQEYVYQQIGVAAPLKITAIRISDMKKFRGSTAAITSGGVGSNEVTIKFTSLRGSGIKSTVQIYGA